MNQKNIKTSLLKIIKPYLPQDISINEVTENKHLINDLQINSAHIVDIVLDIEDQFNIMIDDDVIGKMNTVQDSINVVLAKTA